MFKKKQSLDIISKHSSHLSGRLDRLEADLEYSVLADAFESAMELGGLEELDFKRPEGQSYNPRPARIALILLDSGINPGTDLLAAAFIASSDAGNERFSHLCEAQRIALNATSGAAFKPDKCEHSILLELALHLDRARHFHLSDSSKDLKENQKFCDITEKLISIARERNSYLFDFLTHWLNRHTRKKLDS